MSVFYVCKGVSDTCVGPCVSCISVCLCVSYVCVPVPMCLLLHPAWLGFGNLTRAMEEWQKIVTRHMHRKSGIGDTRSTRQCATTGRLSSFIKYSTGGGVSSSLWEAAVGEQSQALNIQEEEASVNAFCTLCQHSHTK